MSTTIRDVARAAQVSIGTVSRALKNQPGLSEATRTRVVQVAQRLGYDMAQLRPGRVRRLAFVLHRQHNNFISSPFFSHVLHGVEQACSERGIAPSMLSVGGGDSLTDLIRVHQPDAVAIAGFVEPELIDAIAATHKPFVLIDLWAPGARSVNIDNPAGAALAMSHLFALGRRRVAFIGGSLAHYSIAERALAYRHAYFNAGLLFDPSLEVDARAGTSGEVAAADAMERLLGRPGGAPDAVFAYNDAAAIAALRVCAVHGVRVPDDIAIVGFDDIPAAAQAGLTTIAVDKEALGRAGIELLLEDGPAQIELKLPARLVERTSTRGHRR
jgi:DNA-binding LacI/PurR family transcriptional regulator